MLLTQLVKPEILARLTESQISILNSLVEAEIITNSMNRKTYTAIAKTSLPGTLLISEGGPAEKK